MSALERGGSSKARDKGTYRAVPKVPWTTLLDNEFGNPDWTALYPIDAKTGNPIGVLSPRLACKLFHDALHIIKQGEEKVKYIQDQLPEISHKQYKKKQWRKQFFECMRRVCCRLVAGLGFRPNCVGEDIFVCVILNQTFALGWRRINQFIEPLPETEKDRDFTRVARLADADIANLMKGAETVATATNPAASTSAKKPGKIDAGRLNVKGWFKCYESNTDHVFDHIIKVEDEDMDDWSVSSVGSSTAASGGVPVVHALAPLGSKNVTGPLRSPKSVVHHVREDSNVSDFSDDGAACGAGTSALNVTASLASLIV
ncbi:MAG: hypothetical protein F2825_09665 [Actinobacteria bacterium]|uniref:Unannotated protein n=1 Tax=freshwater metagenome TaxID=449393 RepID=A0A6J7IDG4_9ZZZZ|nr:hypothetical protein [Actinomycetota bacterium]